MNTDEWMQLSELEQARHDRDMLADAVAEYLRVKRIPHWNPAEKAGWLKDEEKHLSDALKWARDAKDAEGAS